MDLRLVLPLIVLASAPAPATTIQQPEFVGIGRCRMCHVKEYDIWSKSAHAGAFEALKPEEQKKPECLPCHTTGFGGPAAPRAELKSVQCEACHGAGSHYAVADIMNQSVFKKDRDRAHARATEAGLIIPDEAACRSCHNEKSPNFKGFDYKPMLEKIRHW